METALIREFLSVGNGDGYGDGSGYGYGYGSGDGSGYGSGDGSGYGYGDGNGNLCRLKAVNGRQIHDIDGVPTVIRHIHFTRPSPRDGGAADNQGAGYAKGFILRDDLTFEPCYIAKQGGVFAHGKTLRAARDALLEKLFDDMPEEDRVAAFVETHEDGKAYPNTDFFDWHHRLTGSCEMGRREFARAHEIDVENGSMTVREFIALTERDYGGGTIRRLLEFYPEKQKENPK